MHYMSFVNMGLLVQRSGNNYTREGTCGVSGCRDLMFLQLLCSETHSVDHPALVRSNANSHETADSNISEERHMNPPEEWEDASDCTHLIEERGSGGRNCHKCTCTLMEFCNISKMRQ